jgi:hypothetical protein
METCADLFKMSGIPLWFRNHHIFSYIWVVTGHLTVYVDSTNGANQQMTEVNKDVEGNFIEAS